MVRFEDFKGRIRLHGLGFIQVHLAGKRRLHIWHPDLPRRSCYDYSKVHNHRWGMGVQVLVGTQVNVRCQVIRDTTNSARDPTRTGGVFTLFLHEGERNEHASRPWMPDGTCRIIEAQPEYIKAGDVYGMAPLEFHHTPVGDAPVVTLMTKGADSGRGAHSTCAVGHTPDLTFDSHQVPQDRLWDYVRDALRYGE